MSQSTALSGHRLRYPRTAERGLRERLALVPPRARERVRIPFVALIALILATGVAGLLLLNTHMQQGAFQIEKLQAQAATLATQQDDQSAVILKLSDPQRIAREAQGLGMVAPQNPAFLDLSSGKILGVPLAATGADKVDIGGVIGIAPTPAALRPPPQITYVDAPPATTTTTPADSAKTEPSTGAAASGSTNQP